MRSKNQFLKPFQQILILSILLSCNTQMDGQSDTTIANIGGLIDLDSITVTASRADFNVKDFIEMVIEDESFYTAFRNIRFLSYDSENEVKMFDKKGREKASFKNKIQQNSIENCRTMNVLEEEVTGDYFKRKKKHRYYTGKLHDRLFLTHGKICESRKIGPEKPPASKMEKHIRSLKKLIFNPGKKVDVPFIGGKTAIFSEKMAPYYDYSIASKIYGDSIDCYVFKAIVKPEFRIRKKDKTVIKDLETYFDKSTFQVIARHYQLAYAGTAFDFDVTMDIELDQVLGQYIPIKIHYDGWWDVPARKPEISKFSILFANFDNK